MVHVFELPFVVLFPCLVFWIVSLWFLGAFAIRGSIELYNKLFPAKPHYFYNEESHELGIDTGDEITPVGIVAEYDFTTPREVNEP